MPFVKVGDLSAFPPGSVTEVESEGKPYAICNVDGKLHCVEGTCPHAGGPLGQGTLNGNFVVCPWHGWEFDCRTGLNEDDEDVQLQTFPVVVQGGELLIDIP